MAIVAERFNFPVKNLSIADRTRKSVICVCGKFLFQGLIETNEEGRTTAIIKGVNLISCYAPPRWKLEKIKMSKG